MEIEVTQEVCWSCGNLMVLPKPMVITVGFHFVMYGRHTGMSSSCLKFTFLGSGLRAHPARMPPDPPGYLGMVTRNFFHPTKGDPIPVPGCLDFLKP